MKNLLLTLISTLLCLYSSQAVALHNPAAVYCVALGYEYKVEKDERGDVGYCVLGAGQKVDAWQFVLGKIATEKSFCAKQNYKQKIVKVNLKSKDNLCAKFGTDTCQVCVLPDGREVEVTELMGLSFQETTCGDGVCGIPETSKTCPQDCPKERDETKRK